MGTAFAYPCSDNNHNVSVIGTHLEKDFIGQINSSKKHPTLDCDIPKNTKFFKFNLKQYCKTLERKTNKQDIVIHEQLLSTFLC